MQGMGCYIFNIISVIINALYQFRLLSKMDELNSIKFTALPI